MSGKLFDSSSDEESDSEEDSSRFRIKPQFEGRAGKKVSKNNKTWNMSLFFDVVRKSR